MTERVAVIGLDAVEWRLVQRMIADGDLPNVARLHATGATVRLESGMPYRAEAPWVDLLTGRGGE
jgi:predicted AlkP superfamily phosphohydrolase/phosphomutase